MTVPLISCVVPTLNSATTLDTTLLSLRSQKRVNVEVIVADSGSTDATLEICQQWKVPTIYTPPGNMYRAINDGLRQCSGKWLAYINSDDWVYPDSFVRLLAQSEKANADVVYGNCDYVDEQGRFIYSFAAASPRQLLSLFRLKQMGFAQPAAIFSRNLFLELGGFDESLLYRADADFYVRALLTKKILVKLDGPSTACFRLHSKQFSNRGLEQTEIEAEKVFDRKELQANLGDWLTLAGWRIENLPHYAIRILRESLLSKRLRLPSAIEPYTHE